MQYPEVVAVVNSLIPEMSKTRDPQGVLLKYARENNLTPAVLERMGQTFNQGVALQTMLGPNRGAGADLLDTGDLCRKYAAWSPNTEYQKEASSPKTSRIPNLVASMLREKSASSDDLHTLILDMAGHNSRLQLAHWRADTQTNEHEALGDLYDALIGLVDKLAEVSMGKDDNRNFSSVDVTLDPDTTPKDLLQEMNSLAARIMTKVKADGSEDLQNIAADIQEQINRTQYKLQSPATKSAAYYAMSAERSAEQWETIQEDTRELLEKAAAEFSKKLFRDGLVDDDSGKQMILSDMAEADAIRAHGDMAKMAFDWYSVWAAKRWGSTVKRASDKQVMIYKLAHDWSGNLDEASLMVVCFDSMAECIKQAEATRTTVKRHKHKGSGGTAAGTGNPGAQGSGGTDTGTGNPSAQGSGGTATGTGNPSAQGFGGTAAYTGYQGRHLNVMPWREEAPASKEPEAVNLTPEIKTILNLLATPNNRLENQITHFMDEPRRNKTQERVDSSSQGIQQQHNMHKLMLTDPVISKADPDEVASVFESIRRGSDDVASDINLLRFQMREALQYGGVPPDAYKQLLSIGELRDKHTKNTREEDRARYGGGSAPKARA